MRKLFQGMAFILFSIFLVLAAAFDPILSHFWGGGLHLILDLLALILGIVGLVYTLTPGRLELVVSPGKDNGGTERTGD
jgi:hypothetical protein